MKNRIEWIDILKGLLLLFICLSHFGYWPSLITPFIEPTGIVWVSGFFFLSGMLFSSEHYPTFGSYLKGKTRTLLIPYIGFCIIFVLLDWNLYLKSGPDLTEFRKSLLTGIGPPKASPLWFVITLYFTSLAYYLTDKFLKKKPLIFGAILFASSLSFLLFKQNIQLPWRPEVVLASLFFYGLGHIFKNSIISLCDHNSRHRMWAIVLIGILFYSSGYFSDINHGGILAQNKINNYFYFYFSALTGILAIVLTVNLSWQLFRSNQYIQLIFKFLQYISKNALPILATHCYILIVLNQIIKFSLSPGFSNIEFILKMVSLSLLIYFIVVPFCYNKLYFLFGREKQNWKSGITHLKMNSNG